MHVSDDLIANFHTDDSAFSFFNIKIMLREQLLAIISCYIYNICHAEVLKQEY